MFDDIVNSRLPGRGIALIATVVAATSISFSSASAGTCPADKAKADVREMVTHAAKGVTDTTLAAVDLEKEPANLKERQLRFRKLTILPGGIVPSQSCRSPGDHLYRGRRDHRICQQLRGAHHPQDWRNPC